MAKRKSELSLLNVLMCLLVIFVHVISWTIGDMDKSSIAYVFTLIPWRLAQFVVQGFVFLSAVKLFASGKEQNYETFLAGRYKRVVIPYVLWVILYYVYFIKHSYYAYTFSWGSLGTYLFYGTLCSHFYFVVMIMQFYLNLPLFKWLTRRVNVWVLAVLSVVLTALFKQYVHFQYDDRILPAYLCYFMLGAAVGLNYGKVARLLRSCFALVLPLFAIFAAADGYLTYRAQVQGITFKYIEIVHLGYCISAIFFFLTLFLLIGEDKNLSKPISLIDRSSYAIYLSHVLFIYLANDIAPSIEGFLEPYGITLGMAGNLIFRAVFTYAATLGVCMLYTFIVGLFKRGKQDS